MAESVARPLEGPDDGELARVQLEGDVVEDVQQRVACGGRLPPLLLLGIAEDLRPVVLFQDVGAEDHYWMEKDLVWPEEARLPVG